MPADMICQFRVRTCADRTRATGARVWRRLFERAVDAGARDLPHACNARQQPPARRSAPTRQGIKRTIPPWRQQPQRRGGCGSVCWRRLWRSGCSRAREVGERGRAGGPCQCGFDRGVVHVDPLAQQRPQQRPQYRSLRPPELHRRPDLSIHAAVREWPEWIRFANAPGGPIIITSLLASERIPSAPLHARRPHCANDFCPGWSRLRFSWSRWIRRF